MKKSFLLVYDSVFGTREEVKGFLDIPEIITWRYDMPNCFYLVSEQSAYKISEILRERCGGKGKFLVCSLDGERQGWLTPKSWHLINNKEHS